MGQPKLLLPWAGGTILSHLVAQWKTLGAAQIAVVCGPPPHPVWTALEASHRSDVARIINPTPEHGMFSSIQSAAHWSGWNPSLTHVLLALGDQPQISPATLQALLQHAQDHPTSLCQPSLHGRPKHPLVFPRSVLLDLATSRHATLRDFLATQAHRRSLLPTTDPTLNIDLDSPDDYRSALTSFNA